MKRLFLFALLAALAVSFGASARTYYFDDVVIDGSFTMSGTEATSFTGTTFAIDASSTVVIDGATSVRGVSAGFTSLESPANRIGVSATIYMQIATTAVTGVTAITHTGSAPTVTWTADSFSFVGPVSITGNLTHSASTNSGAVYVGTYAIAYTQTDSYTVCTIPANADVLKVEVATTTAFSGGSATTVNIGWTGTVDGYASALSVRSAGIAAGDEFGNLGDVGSSTRDVLAQITTDDSAGACVVRVYWTTATPGSP